MIRHKLASICYIITIRLLAEARKIHKYVPCIALETDGGKLKQDQSYSRILRFCIGRLSMRQAVAEKTASKTVKLFYGPDQEQSLCNICGIYSYCYVSFKNAIAEGL